MNDIASKESILFHKVLRAFNLHTVLPLFTSVNIHTLSDLLACRDEVIRHLQTGMKRLEQVRFNRLLTHLRENDTRHRDNSLESIVVEHGPETVVSAHIEYDREHDPITDDDWGAITLSTLTSSNDVLRKTDQTLDLYTLYKQYYLEIKAIDTINGQLSRPDSLKISVQNILQVSKDKHRERAKRLWGLIISHQDYKKYKTSETIIQDRIPTTLKKKNVRFTETNTKREYMIDSPRYKDYVVKTT
jgi:hypothetical protein